MKIHLPLPIRRSLLAGIACAAAGCINGAFAMAESQNLFFDGTTLTWNTDADNAVFLTADGTASHFTPGDNVNFTNNASVTLGEDITAGTIKIESEADVIILQDNYVLEAERFELAGTLDAGDSLTIDNRTILAVESAQAILNSNLVLGNGGNLASGAAANLNGNTLALHGGTGFSLTATGDGKTYTLFTGVTELKDSQGNAITLNSTNNAISNYFDTTQPGTGFWADATLVFNDGTLQLMRHNETVKEAVTITTRQNNGADYQYHAGVTFENLVTSSDGGAIYGPPNSTITLSNNGSVEFIGNTASYGGAIYGGYYTGYGSTITLSNNGSVEFIGNTASYGGAIYGGSSSTITLSNNGSVEFIGNTASSSSCCGGAIYGRSTITLSNNGNLTFCNNTALNAGAIYGDSGSTITLSNNGSVAFIGNTASYGGAIYGGSTITLSNNGSVAFIGNTASYGGAIRAYGNLSICNNGNLTFSNNTALNAGAIYGDSSSTITLSNNGSVEFIGNLANSASSTAYGGAIRAYGNLCICNNDSVLFEKNAEVSEGAYRLRSIYAGGSGDVSSLSAAEGKSIEFRDSVYIDSGSTFNLNADYTDAAGVTHKQQGDIVFTGATTVDDLYIVKGNVAGTDEEILNSRTTEVNTLTNLYGGRLRVEEGAIYKGRGITAMEESNATVMLKSATMIHEGYDVTFNAGTSLDLRNNVILVGNIQMLSGSTLIFNPSDHDTVIGITEIYGSLHLNKDATFIVDASLTEHYPSSGEQESNLPNNTVLMYVKDSVTGWEDANLSIPSNLSLTWVGNMLVYNYDASTFTPYYNKNAEFTIANEGVLSYHHYTNLLYRSVSGCAITANKVNDIEITDNIDVTICDNSGGAITGSQDGIITLSRNNNLEFRGNYRSGQGGAICSIGSENSKVEICDNNKVIFKNNSATDDGGAIYGKGKLYLNRNNSVEISGNSISGTGDMLGGAIVYFGASTSGEGSKIEICNNKVVIISNNSGKSTTNRAIGGAIACSYYTDLLMEYNGAVDFTSNEADYGGALYGGASHGGVSSLNIINNNSVKFYNNHATKAGGAIVVDIATMQLSHNNIVEFVGNESFNGGAISHAIPASIFVDNNDSVLFRGNKASGIGTRGGAIGCYATSTSYLNEKQNVFFNNNSSIIFEENIANGNGAEAGAIHCGISVFRNNDSILFRNNAALADSKWAVGGAILGNVEITNTDYITFSGNRASTSEQGVAYGGAIYGFNLKFTDNGSLTFNDNSVVSSSGTTIGGAIHIVLPLPTVKDRGLAICNNDDVLFQRNYEKNNGVYRLRSIYVDNNVEGKVIISAADGKQVEFRDSIFIGEGNTFSLNTVHTDTEGISHEQNGDIIFTGRSTSSDLYTVKSDIAGTQDEIRNSRTSEVNTMTNLYGGCLRVEDGAVYKGNGITAHADSSATVRVKDAELSHVGHDLTFNAGTVLEVAGASTIRGNVELLEKSMFRLEQAASLSLHETQASDAATMTVNGTALLEGNSTLNASLTLADGATLDMDVLNAGAVTLNGALTFAGEVYMGTHLQDILSEMRGWKESVTLFTGLTDFALPQSLSLTGDGYLSVGDVFSNMVGNQTHYLAYEANVGCLSVVYIPETTTTTLSLLALTVLTTRRKRKITP